MRKRNRLKRIQERLNKATYPVIITGWQTKEQREAARQIGIATAKELRGKEKEIRERIKDVIVRGTHVVYGGSNEHREGYKITRDRFKENQSDRPDEDGGENPPPLTWLNEE